MENNLEKLLKEIEKLLLKNSDLIIYSDKFKYESVLNSLKQFSIQLLNEFVVDYDVRISPEYDETIEEYVMKYIGNGLIEEKTIPVTFSTLQRKLGWEKFCDVTGTDYYCKNEGYEIKDSEIFQISKSIVDEYGL